MCLYCLKQSFGIPSTLIVFWVNVKRVQANTLRNAPHWVQYKP